MSDPRQLSRRRFWENRDATSYRCPGCGRSRDEVDAVEVHHRDKRKTNASDDNLIGLCRRCHQRGEHDRRSMDIPSSLDSPRPYGVGKPSVSIENPGL